MSGWYFAGICLLAYLVLWIWVERKRTKDFIGLAAQRPSLSEKEFVAALAPDIDPDISKWLRDKIAEYIEPALTPHPEDDIVTDLHIDDDEAEDWFLEFCHNFGHDADLAQDWPREQAVTVRNFLHWLQDTRRLMG